jgi:hypothetical protein
MSVLPPTPSRSHEEARRRHIGHDQIQADLLVFLQKRLVSGVRPTAEIKKFVDSEFPLRRNGRIVSFVDCAEILTVDRTTVVSLFEVKPKIDTVFGIKRQCLLMLDLAEKSIQADQYYCHVGVPFYDPLLLELRKAWPLTWAWGITFGSDE